MECCDNKLLEEVLIKNRYLTPQQIQSLKDEIKIEFEEKTSHHQLQVQKNIDRLVMEFRLGTFPFKEWNHLAHLRVALWYLYYYPKEEATWRIRNGIQKYNEANDIPVSETGGYHETITIFWIHVLHSFLIRYKEGRSLEELAAKAIELYQDKRYPLNYYSRERIMSWEARLSWLEPDIKPLEL